MKDFLKSVVELVDFYESEAENPFFSSFLLGLAICLLIMVSPVFFPFYFIGRLARWLVKL